ncbi:hypothetical protein BDW22DRAFT_1441667 [Trametopsis cervina]|nr:hypothetical protein BDW22DRAFT_1441667 [Trametopsis cervina]
MFVAPDSSCRDTVNRPTTLAVPHKTAHVYIAGYCTHERTASARSGAGVWSRTHPSLARALWAPGTSPSTLLGELHAVLAAVRLASPTIPLRIVTESATTPRTILSLTPGWEARGWINVENRDILQAIISHCRARQATTSFQIATSPKQRRRIQRALSLAQEGSRSNIEVDNGTPFKKQRFLLTGAVVSHLTQSLIYQGLREQSELSVPLRPRTAEHITLIQNALAQHLGEPPRPCDIWTAIRSKTNSRKISSFLWRLIHQGFHCGSWWSHIPGFEHRALCTHCGVLDTLQHILTECRIPGQQEIWSWVRWIMNKKGVPIPALSMGLIMGVNLSCLRDVNLAPRPGTTRLFQIVVTESLHLIWRLRCERVIEFDSDRSRWPTPSRIRREWYTSLDKRLALDMALTSRAIQPSRGLSTTLALATWSGTLEREADLPENWIYSTGVLVGRPPERVPPTLAAQRRALEFRDDG